MTISDELICQALELSRARGAALLSLLGNFDAWQGNLAEMRDDSGQSEEQATGDQPKATGSGALADVLLIARAIEMLDDECRTALSNTYLPEDGATAAEPKYVTAGGAVDRERVVICKRRLVDISAELERHAAGPAVPDWVAEREHAALTASHGRRRG